MQKTIPTLRSFILRFIVMMGSGAGVAAGSLIAYHRLVVLVTPADQKVISSYGVPISAAGIVVFVVLITLVALPLIRYIRAVHAGREIPEDQALKVQHQALNLGYKIAIIAGLFYMITNPVIFMVGIINLEWDMGEMVWYGMAGGLICGLFMIPLGVNFGGWVVRPLVEHTTTVVKTEPARRAGWRFSLSFKMLVTFIPIIIALLLYSSLMGYSQTRSLLENMRQMEERLPAREKMDLVDQLGHRSDPGIRSSRYFQKNLGNLKTSYTVFILIGIGLTFLFILLASAETTRPLRILTRASERIKEGDFEESVRLATNDELGELGASMNRMKDTIVSQMREMGHVVESLKEGVRQMDSAISTMLNVSASQASGAAQQASSITEASSVTEQILATARSIADHAGDVNQSSSSTLDACKQGEQVLDTAHKSFEQIASQSQEIVEATSELEGMFQLAFGIVGIIEEVADQTELLALNASIEAAGAGSAGSRFSVVAEETQHLASRTNEATAAVRELIETIQQATVKATGIARAGNELVGRGRGAVADVVDALAKISSLAHSTATLVHEITSSTTQQSHASEELSRAINEVQEVASQVESGAKEIEAAVAELKSFAQTLRETVEDEHSG